MSLHKRAGSSSKLYIDNIQLVSGPPKGVSFEGNIVKISEELCCEIGNDKHQNILVTYSLVGEHGIEIPKTAMFNLSTTEQGPLVSSCEDYHSSMKNGEFCFDLLSESTVDLLSNWENVLGEQIEV